MSTHPTTLRMKLTPKPGSELNEITWYSCPNFDRIDPKKVLAKVQKIADARHVAVIYSLVDDCEYYAMRGARMWLMTEPDDESGNKKFKGALLNAGFITTPFDQVTFECNGKDDYTVLVTTASEFIEIDTKHSVITRIPAPDFTPRAVTTLHPSTGAVDAHE